MFNVADSHQFFENYDDHDVLVCRWTMDKIRRKDRPVWIINHFFINPSYEKKLEEILAGEMKNALLIAEKSQIPLWPLDPLVIDYFKKHHEFHKYWYHKPYSEE